MLVVQDPVHTPSCHQFCRAGRTEEPLILHSLSSFSNLQDSQPGKQLTWDKTLNWKQNFHSRKQWLGMQGLGGQRQELVQPQPPGSADICLCSSSCFYPTVHLEIKLQWSSLQSSLHFTNSRFLVLDAVEKSEFRMLTATNSEAKITLSSFLGSDN